MLPESIQLLHTSARTHARTHIRARTHPLTHHTYSLSHSEVTHQHEIMCHSLQHNGLHTKIGCIGLYLVSHDDSIITSNHDCNGNGQLLCCLCTGFCLRKKGTQLFEVSRQSLPPRSKLLIVPVDNDTIVMSQLFCLH